MPSASPNPTQGTDPEERFAVADPGKEWRRGHRIPVVPALDGFRAYAILCVALFHIFQVSGVFGAAGDSAVAVLAWGLLTRSLEALFIISGFVIYLPTAARDGEFGSVQSFAIRRVARLVPAYYLALLIALGLLATVSSEGLPGLGSIGAHLTMLQTPALLVANGFNLGFGVVPPVWTLSVEAGLYIVVPFVAAHYFRHPFIGLAVAVAIMLGWTVLAHHADSVAGLFGASLSPAAENRIELFYAHQFPSWAVAFAAGMTGAWLYVRLRDRYPTAQLARRALWLTALALPAFGVFVYLAGDGAVHDVNPFLGLYARQSDLIAIGYPLSQAALILSIVLAPTWLQSPFAASPSRWLGDISYSVYLIHFAVIWFVLHQFSFPSDGSVLAVLAWSVVVYPVSIGYAYLSARFLERPVRRWAHQFGRRAQARGETAPARAT